jgi:hypothetical protein
MTRWLLPSIGIVSALALALGFGCGDDETQNVTTLSTSSNTQSTGVAMGGGSSTSTTATGMGGNGNGGAPAEYPPGPYGNQVGQTFPYLEWEGYVNSDPTMLANTAPWTDTYTANEVHNSGAPFALIHTALSG